MHTEIPATIHWPHEPHDYLWFAPELTDVSAGELSNEAQPEAWLQRCIYFRLALP